VSWSLGPLMFRPTFGITREKAVVVTSTRWTESTIVYVDC
jgi:hypothetical protein